MTPYYDDGVVTIYHDDCLPLISGGCDPYSGKPTPGLLGTFDLLLTDPPYGLNITKNGTVGGGGASAAKFRKWERSRWDECTQPNALAAGVESCRSAIVWGGNYYDLPRSRCWLVWDKGQRDFSLADGELAWTNLDRAVRILTIPRSPKQYRLQAHPTAKPVELMSWSISQVVSHNVTSVLDPFAGSGPVGVACKLAGIRCVLIEAEERYCEIAAKRCAQGVLDFGAVQAAERG